MITMLDVAKKAGVSKATVSRVLAGNSYVSKTTQDKVFKAIEETGYRLNLLARNLATSKSQNIGLVVTNTLYNGPYFSELLFQAATVTEQHGRQLILADGKHDARQERQAIEFLLDLRCDAIIIYPRFLNTAELDEIIEQTSKPIIVVNRQLQQHPQHCVFAAHEQNTFDAVNYLVAEGHRDIAFIAGSPGSPTGTSRLNGYRAALHSHHLPFDERLSHTAAGRRLADLKPGSCCCSAALSLPRWWRVTTIWRLGRPGRFTPAVSAFRRMFRCSASMISRWPPSLCRR